MIKSKKQSLIVIGVFTLVMLLGTTTFAFFNYTRTGSSNIIKTGRIYFNSEQGTSINLTNLFPIDTTETGVMDDATKVGTVTINVVGDTTYSGGIEYLVSAANVQNTIGSKQLPISIQVSVEDNNENDPSTSLGTLDADYFTNRGTNAQTSIYKVLASDVIENNDQLVVGYIKSGQDGVDGNIVIKAYIDKNKIAISDTYPEETKREVVENYSTSACETALTGNANASTYCANAEALESALGSLTNEQLTALVTAGVLKEYTNGTPASFGEGRTVLTTTEWNSLQTNGVSFQVKVEANEGVWVEEVLSRNDMASFNTYGAELISSAQRSTITEISFIRMSEEMIDAHDDLIDLTADGGQGVVKAWVDGTKLYIASPGETYFPVNSSGLFANYSNVTKINFNNINTSNVTNMSAMFNNCISLTSIDLDNFDTSNVTDMYAMFRRCEMLTSMNISHLNTSNVRNMSVIFAECKNLIYVNINNLGSNNLNDASAMFNSSSKLEKIDMSGFNFGQTSYVLNNLFGTSSSLNNLKYVNMKNVNLGNITDLTAMFYGRKELIYVDLSGVDTSNISNMLVMFYECSKLERIYVSDLWKTDSVTNSNVMFSGCTSLVGGSGTVYDANHIDKEYARIDGGTSNPGYLTLKTN